MVNMMPPPPPAGFCYKNPQSGNCAWDDDGRSLPASFVSECYPNPIVGAKIALPAKYLADAYGLTLAELKLTEALAHHCDLGRSADAVHVSYNTAKTHLKNIFRKTGCRKQMELIKLLLIVAIPAPDFGIFSTDAPTETVRFRSRAGPASFQHESSHDRKEGR